jgi:hypothetical protein
MPIDNVVGGARHLRRAVGRGPQGGKGADVDHGRRGESRGSGKCSGKSDDRLNEGPSRDDCDGVMSEDTTSLRSRTSDSVVTSDPNGSAREALSFCLSLIEAKDSCTRGHCARVATVAMRIASRLGLDESDIQLIGASALVHDLGKVGVPDSILSKPGRLTDGELEVVRRHPQIGQRLIAGFDALRFASDAVLWHHERWDGMGYPHRARGCETPLAARIICVADSFDAMCSERPYARAMTTARAAEEVIGCSGTQFDPEIASLFCEHDPESWLPAESSSDSDLPGAIGSVCGIVPATATVCRQVSKLSRSGARKADMLEAEAPFVKMVAGSLTPAERLVLELYYAEKLAVAEIAEVLETTEDAVRCTLEGVRRRVTVARKALIDALVEA